jgi:hypothetical protein
MRNIKLWGLGSLSVVLCIVLSSVAFNGCINFGKKVEDAVAVKVDSLGVAHTDVTDAAKKVADTIGSAVPMVNTFAPGYGMLASGVSALLGLGASAFLAFRTKSQSNKLNTASGVIETIVQGVNVAKDNYDELKTAILDTASGVSLDAGKKVSDLFNKFEADGKGIKNVIKQNSVDKENVVAVASAVAKV